MSKKEQKPIDFTWMKPGIEIWVQCTDAESQEVFYKAKLVDANLDTCDAKIEKKTKEIEIVKADQIFPINKQDSQGFNDMVDMENLNEAELLYNVKVRYEQNKIFTYVGPTLLAINPYMLIPELFSEDILKHFQVKCNETRFSLKEHQPHIYAIAAEVYRNLFENRRNQAIVISGESGAGKTEETKLAMKFMTSMGKNQHLNQVKMLFSTQTLRKSGLIAFEDENDNVSIEEKILSCNPILEAFGNAKTIRNDNSSRFGKLVLLLIQKENRKIKGAVTTNYLLEKSRITAQAIGERNYHIFYLLLKGASKEMLSSLELEDMKKYDYLKKSNCFHVPTINDEALYNEVCQSFTTMKVSKEEQKAIWSMVAAILHLGNIDFNEKTLDNNNPCTILGKDLLEKAAKLLGINPQNFTHNILHKTRIVGKQEINSKLNRNDCLALRDSLTKGIYERLFNWIVRRLNYAISTEEYRKKRFEEIMHEKDRFSIGLLDIFGFEVFKINSFEQFCINFANEKLQQLYIAYVFKAEIDEFVKEGLKEFLCELNFKDNQPIIDLLEKNPLGIYNLIDESSSVSSTDENLLQTIFNKHKEDLYLKAPKIPRDTFIIVHTAKDVEYNIQGFRVKNKDELSNSLSQLIKSSENKQVSEIFSVIISGQKFTEDDEGGDDGSPQIQVVKAKSSKSDKFLGAKFREQMRDLMSELNSCECHFVRCIKPNENKQKQQFAPLLALTQIRYLGVLESIKIRKESYPIRRIYAMFFEKYFELSEASLKESYITTIEKKPDLKEFSKKIVAKNLPDAGTAKVLFGNTKVFMRVDIANILDNILSEKIKVKTVMACRIQRTFFNYIQIKKLRRFFKALKRIQNLMKVRIEYKKFRNTINGTKKIQRAFKKNLFRKGVTSYFDKIDKMKDASNKIGSFAKMIKVKSMYIQKKSKINDITRLVRGYLARCFVRRFRLCKRIVEENIFDKAWRTVRRVFEKDAALIIQKYARRYIVKRKFKKQIIKIKKAKQDVIDRKAAIKIQKVARTYIVKQKIKGKHKAAFKIQGFIKMKWLSALFQDLRKNVLIIQKAAKKWLLNRAIMKERWKEYDYSDMGVFQKNRCLERDIIFGKKEVALKLSNTTCNSNTLQKDSNQNALGSKTNFESIEKEKTRNVMKLEKEEDLMNLMDDDDHSYDHSFERAERNRENDKDNDSDIIHEFESRDDLDESGLLEQLVGYDQNSKSKNNDNFKGSSQKPVQTENDVYELDVTRKIVLFPMIVDIDMIGDPSDLYKPLWASLYNAAKLEALKYDASIQLVELGETFTICATDNGKLFTWGSNDFFQLGRNTNENEESDRSSIGMVRLDNLTSEHSQIQKVVAGDSHVFVLDNQKNLYCWGDNYIGQLGLGHNKIMNELVVNKVLPARKMVDIQSKGIYNVGLTDEGKLLLWPFQKSNGKFFYKPVELPLPSGITITSISCGNNFVILIGSNGYLYSFGKDNLEGQLGQGDTKPRNVPAVIESMISLGEKIVTVSCGFKHTICKSSLGKVFVWGAGDFGQLGTGSFTSELTPKLIKPEKYSDQKHSVNKVLQIKAGFRSCIMLIDNRKVYWWGTNSVLDREKNPRYMDYGVFLELSDDEKASDYMPIRLLSSWNKTCSVMYITMADCTRVSSHLPVIQKCCNNLSSKWEAQTIDPPFIESFSKHFTMKALKKIAIRSKKSADSKLPTDQKQAKKLTKEDKDKLYEIFIGNSKRETRFAPLKTVASTKAFNSSLTRAKSPPRFDKVSEDEKEEALKSIKSKAINLMKTRKESWRESDHELMKLLSDPGILSLFKQL